MWTILDEDDPIELLDGLLFVKEPRSSPHRTAVLLVGNFRTRLVIRDGRRLPAAHAETL